MNSKNKRRIYLYYVENIFLVVIIISLFLAISLNKQNIEYLKREINKIPKNEENMIRKKAKYIALLLYILLMWRMWTMLKKKLKQENYI